MSASRRATRSVRWRCRTPTALTYVCHRAGVMYGGVRHSFVISSNGTRRSPSVVDGVVGAGGTCQPRTIRLSPDADVRARRSETVSRRIILIIVDGKRFLFNFVSYFRVRVYVFNHAHGRPLLIIGLRTVANCQRVEQGDSRCFSREIG